MNTPQRALLKCAISDGMRYAYDYDEMGRMIRKERQRADPVGPGV